MRDSQDENSLTASVKRRRQDFESNMIGFLMTELDLASTFIKIAKSDGEEKTVRNRKNARKAYDTVVYFLGKGAIPQEEEAEIRVKLAPLKSDLQSLGEAF